MTDYTPALGISEGEDAATGARNSNQKRPRTWGLDIRTRKRRSPSISWQNCPAVS